MMTIDLAKTKKAVPLPDGGRVVLIDMLAAPAAFSDDEVERNIFRLDSASRVVWQVARRSPVYARSPFTNIYFAPDGQLMAYSWDGVEHTVDLDTGHVTPKVLLK